MTPAAAVLIRPGEVKDVHFLRNLLPHTGLGRSGRPVDEEPPPLSRYVSGWGRPGDAAVVALDATAHVAVGAAWYRRFTDAEHGFGYVDAATPELSMAVVPNRRRQGIGQQLLDAIVARARADGFTALSLSAEQDGELIQFFERSGFRRVAERGPDVTMLLDLA